MRRSHAEIGLFGGSFNPAHAGHLHVASTSLKALDLDEVWWDGRAAKSAQANPAQL